MSSGGGKSGSETKETDLPDWLKTPIQKNIRRAENFAETPFRPYMGPEVAAFDPNQVAAFQNNTDAARAFGFGAPADAMAGMPDPFTYANGMRGYDSMGIFDEAMAKGKERDPDAYEMYDAMFGKNAGYSTGDGGVMGNGNGGGGGGGSNAVDPNQVNIDRMREERRAREAQRQVDAKATQNYLDDSQMSFSDPRKSPGHPSNFNYTPTTPTQTYDTSGGNPFGYSDAPYQNQNLGARDIHSGSAMEQQMQNPIDEQIARYYEELKAGK